METSKMKVKYFFGNDRERLIKEWRCHPLYYIKWYFWTRGTTIIRNESKPDGLFNKP
jgi:hypothetical protein